MWVSLVRPVREHDTTCARAHGPADALIRLAAALDVPALAHAGAERDHAR